MNDIFWNEYSKSWEDCAVLNTITVEKSKLLETLKKNMNDHIAIVKEAKAGYIEEAKRVFAEKLKLVEEKGIVDTDLDLEPPQNNIKEYEQAISMLEWEQAATVQLMQQSFKQYVLDDWSWKHSFLVSNSKYSSTASGCLLN